MTWLSAFLGIIAAAIIGALIESLLKPFVRSNLKHLVSAIVAIIVLTIVASRVSMRAPATQAVPKQNDVGSIAAPSAAPVRETAPTATRLPASTPPPTQAPTPTVVVSYTPIAFDFESPDYTVKFEDSDASRLYILTRQFPGIERLIVYSLRENVMGDFFCDEVRVTNAGGEKIEPGLYVAFVTPSRENVGAFGVPFSRENGCVLDHYSVGRNGIVFPVHPGQRTVVTVSLVDFEIGLVRNGEAVPDAFLSIQRMEPPGDGVTVRTGPDGVARIRTGVGTYDVCYRPFNDRDNCMTMTIPPNETHWSEVWFVSR